MRKRTVVAFIIVLIMIITIPVSVILITRNKDENPYEKPPQTKTDIEYVGYAIEKVAEKNNEIYTNYAESSASDVSPYAATALTLDGLNDYFGALSQCYVVPYVMDYIINSSSSNAYSNTFELGKTYFSRIVDGESILIYYYKVEKIGSLINCFLTLNDSNLICQINYDFNNDKLISAKTIADGMFAIIDYSRNDFSFVEFEATKTLNEIFAGDIDYGDVVKNGNGIIYRGNITHTVNEIEFEKIELDNTQGTDLIFNNYVGQFKLGINVNNVFNINESLQNNSFYDAVEYSMRKSMFKVRQSPTNEYEYEFIPNWINYDKILLLLEEIAKSEKLSNKISAQNLVTAYKNRLVQRGEGAYVGDNEYVNGSSYLKVSKVYDEIDAYVVTIIIDGEVLEFSCQYKNNNLTMKHNDYQKQFYGIEVSNDNTYVIITNVNSSGVVVDIPTEMEVDVNGTSTMLPVKELKNLSVSSQGRTIVNIPASVEKITFTPWFDAASINVAEDNDYYCSVDGVIFTKDMKKLVRYPNYRRSESYTIPNGVETIEEDGFRDLNYLKELNVPSSLISGLDNRTFYATKSLTTINVVSGSVYTSYDGVVYSTNGKKLYMCPTGKTGVVDIRYGTEEICEYAFEYCRYLTKINIPSTVKKFGIYAFRLCESIEEFTIPASVTDVGYGFDFEGTDALNKVIIGEGSDLFSVDKNGFVYSKDGKTLYFCPRNIEGSVTIRNGVEKINDYAFQYCTKVTEVIVPESVTEIGYEAFFGSGIKKATINGTVKVGGYLFMRSELEEIYIKGLVVESYEWDKFAWNNFDECDNLSIIRFGGTKTEWLAAVSTEYSYENYELPKMTVKCTDGDLIYG